MKTKNIFNIIAFTAITTALSADATSTCSGFETGCYVTYTANCPDRTGELIQNVSYKGGSYIGKIVSTTSTITEIKNATTTGYMYAYGVPDQTSCVYIIEIIVDGQAVLVNEELNTCAGAVSIPKCQLAYLHVETYDRI